MSNLLKELRNLPQFANLEKALKENLNSENEYVEASKPNAEFYERPQDANEDAIDNLVNSDFENYDNLDGFIHESIRADVTDLIQVFMQELLKEYYGKEMNKIYKGEK